MQRWSGTEFDYSRVGGKGVSRACRASWLCDRTFAREQHPGQQPRHGQAAPRQGGLRAPLLGSVRHRSSYQGKCYDYHYQRFIKRSCPCACHDGTGGGRITAPLIISALHGGEWSTLSPCHFTPRKKRVARTH